MIKIMVRNLQAPENGWFDIDVWKKDFQTEEWYQMVVDAILEDEDLDVSEENQRLSVDAIHHTIDLISDCTIPGVKMSFNDIALEYKVWE